MKQNKVDILRLCTFGNDGHDNPSPIFFSFSFWSFFHSPSRGQW